MSETRWYLDMTAEPIVRCREYSSPVDTNGAELQRLILNGFSEGNARDSQPIQFEKVFSFKEHGEFFRGAALMASIRYGSDFYDFLKQYGMVTVKISRLQKVSE